MEAELTRELRRELFLELSASTPSFLIFYIISKFLKICGPTLLTHSLTLRLSLFLVYCTSTTSSVLKKVTRRAWRLLRWRTTPSLERMHTIEYRG